MKSNYGDSGSNPTHNGKLEKPCCPEAALPCEDETDKALLARLHAAEGAETAFSTLYARHQSWVQHLAERWVEPNLAWDVSQEVFRSLWVKTPDARLCGPVKSVLARLVKCKAADLLRKRRRYEFLEPCALDLHPGPTPAISEGEWCELWFEIQADLTPRLYRVFFLCYHEGLTHSEIADLEQLPFGTVSRRIHIALKKLAERAKKSEDFSGLLRIRE